MQLDDFSVSTACIDLDLPSCGSGSPRSTTPFDMLAWFGGTNWERASG